jgi:hypothetical protein
VIRSPVPLPTLTRLTGPLPETCDIDVVRVDFEGWGSATDETEWKQDEGRRDGPPTRGARRWSRRTPEGRVYRYRFDYLEHAAEFLFNADGSQVRAGWTFGVTDADVAVLISGPVLGRALRLRGAHCLHTTTVTIDGSAVCLLGPSGAGKSSFAAALVHAGCALHSDDQTTFVCRDSRFLALPGQPGLRLWSDSAAQLASTEERRRIWPGIGDLEKFVVELPRKSSGPGAGDGAVPVAALYLLAPRARGGAGIELLNLPPAQRVAILCANVYGGMEPSPAVRAKELAFFARLAASVPVGGLRLPHGLELIEGAARAFIERVRKDAA